MRHDDTSPAAVAQLRVLMTHALDAENYTAADNILASLKQVTGVSADFIFLTEQEMLAPLPDISWFCKALDLSPGRPAKIVGVGGGGKSIAMQSMALATISGQLLWGQFPIRHGRVVHLDYEMGQHPSLARYRALANGHGIPWPDVCRSLRLAPMPRVYMNKPEFEAALRKAVDGCELALIDSLRRAMPGENENDSALTQYIDVVTRVSNDTGCTVILAHHSSPKTPSQQGTRDIRGAGRGSSAIHDAGGSELLFESDDGKPTRVRHTRAFLGGQKHEPFTLEILDTDGGKDVPGGGMRVVATLGGRAGQVAASESIMVKDVLECIKANPGISQNMLSQRVGAGKPAIKSALDRLDNTDLAKPRPVEVPGAPSHLGWYAV